MLTLRGQAQNDHIKWLILCTEAILDDITSFISNKWYHLFNFQHIWHNKFHNQI